MGLEFFAYQIVKLFHFLNPAPLFCAPANILEREKREREREREREKERKKEKERER